MGSVVLAYGMVISRMRMGYVKKMTKGGPFFHVSEHAVSLDVSCISHLILSYHPFIDLDFVPLYHVYYIQINVRNLTRPHTHTPQTV